MVYFLLLDEVVDVNDPGVKRYDLDCVILATTIMFCNQS